MVQIQKADPVARRKAIIGIALGLVIGCLLFLMLEWLLGNVNQWIERHAEFLVEHHYIAFLVMLVPVAPVIAFSGYLIIYAGRIVKSGRFPPPGTAVIRDVRVIEGRSAIIRGRVAQLLCWIILLSASAIPLIIWYIFYSISCVA
jgi:hypothetical protein